MQNNLSVAVRKATLSEVMDAMASVPRDAFVCVSEANTVSAEQLNAKLKRGLENGDKAIDVCQNEAAEHAGVLTQKILQDPKKRRFNDEPTLYSAEHKGEFMVLVDTSEAENIKNKKVKNGLYFIEKIKDIKAKEFNSIKRVDAIGVTLYKISFENRISANNFIQNEDLKKKKLRAFVPRNFVETFGVIRNVPVCFSEEDLLKGIVSDRKVTSVKRFTRKEGSEVRQTETIKIGFSGDNHPAWVVFNHTVLVVNTFYPAVRLCFNCGRLGHTKMGCRSKTRCLQCSNEMCEGNCNFKKCVLCKSSDHSCKEKEKCSTWAKEIETNKIMTRKKMSRKEVITMYNMKNRFDILWDEENFPNLPSTAKNNTTKTKKLVDQSVDNEVNEIMTPFTYSSVAKKPVKRYIHKPGVSISNRMFEEPSPSKPVFVQEHQRTTELEKITKELVKFMLDVFKNNNNSIGIEAMKHFNDRIQKCGVSLDLDDNELKSQNQHGQGKNTTI